MLACLAFALLVTVPLAVGLISRSVQSLLRAEDLPAVAEALSVLVLVIAPDLLGAVPGGAGTGSGSGIWCSTAYSRRGLGLAEVGMLAPGGSRPA
ncbi:hypothetical protein [Nonomuraea sp. NPDC050786]|uniref:hypothetical protein n=1 Tax=Nonomuraea sp. NPDC050786 TaxID=3154840 RepID=UPI0033F95C34